MEIFLVGKLNEYSILEVECYTCFIGKLKFLQGQQAGQTITTLDKILSGISSSFRVRAKILQSSILPLIFLGLALIE